VQDAMRSVEERSRLGSQKSVGIGDESDADQDSVSVSAE
jgi:hypothetical protein